MLENFSLFQEYPRGKDHHFFHMMVMKPYGQDSSTQMVIESAAALRVPAAMMKKFASRNKELVMRSQL